METSTLGPTGPVPSAVVHDAPDVGEQVTANAAAADWRLTLAEVAALSPV